MYLCFVFLLSCLHNKLPSKASGLKQWKNLFCSQITNLGRVHWRMASSALLSFCWKVGWILESSKGLFPHTSRRWCWEDADSWGWQGEGFGHYSLSLWEVSMWSSLHGSFSVAEFLTYWLRILKLDTPKDCVRQSHIIFYYHYLASEITEKVWQSL